LSELPVTVSSARNEYGSTVLHRELESTVAAFLRKEDALVLNMGFNTYARTIPALMGPGDLLLSDELNHASIVDGASASDVAIRIFRHNDMDHLDSVLREAVVMGGLALGGREIYSGHRGRYLFHGERILRFAQYRGVCKKYGAYVYLDEARNGCDGARRVGTDTADIDIMMGTFTKSFCDMGGYIAASKETIAVLRLRCSGSAYHNALSPVVCQQVLTSF
jgi:serine palmitoyltransferase